MQSIKQRKLSAHPKLINKKNSRSEIRHYFDTKQIQKVNELTLMHLYISSIGLNHVATGTHQIFLSISLAHPDLFR